MTEYDDLLGQANAGEFDTPLATKRTGDEDPEPEPDAPGFFSRGVGDVLAAPFRGIEGAIQSTYSLADVLAFDALPDYRDEDRLLGKSHTIVGGLLEGVTQFGAGFYTLGGAVGALSKVKGLAALADANSSAVASFKAAKAVTKLSTTGMVATGVLTDFTVFDGQSGRLADLVAKIPGLEEPMNEYLSFTLTDEEDGQVLGRLKNAIEGAGIGAAIDGIVHGVRWMREINKAKGAGKTPDEALEAANKVVPLETVQKEARQLDDLRFAEESPFQNPNIDAAIAKSDETVVQLNVDGTDAPTLKIAEVQAPMAVKAVPAPDWAIEGLRDAGWDPSWPIIPADLNNPRLRETVLLDPTFSAADKQRMFEAGRKLGVVPASDFDAAGKVRMPPANLPALPDPEFKVRTFLANQWGQDRPNLKALLKSGSESAYHETNLAGAKSIFRQVESNHGQRSIDVSDNPDLALGQGGQGVVLEFDTTRVNGRSNTGKPGLEFSEASGLGGEYVIEQSTVGSLRSITFKSERGLAAAAKSEIANRFDFDGATKTEAGWKVERKIKKGPMSTGGAGRGDVPSAASFVGLSSKLFPGRAITKPALSNWVNQHSTLLDNPQTTIQLDHGTATIGLTLRPDQVTPETSKLIGSLTKDMSPGELGRAARDITAPGTQTARQGAGSPRGMIQPDPENPTGFMPEGEVKSQQPPGVQQSISPTGPTPSATLFGKLGYGTEQQDAIGKAIGGAFEEGKAERGKLLYEFNRKANAPDPEGTSTLPFPRVVTDASNPRKFTDTEKLQLALRDNSPNLEVWKGPDGAATGYRTIDQLVRATRDADGKTLGGVKAAEMDAEDIRQFAQLAGVTNATDFATKVVRESKAHAGNVKEAAHAARTYKTAALSLLPSVELEHARLLKIEEKGAKAAPWEWASVAENIGILEDLVAGNSAILDALGRGLWMQRMDFVPHEFGARVTAAQLREDPAAVERILSARGGIDAVRDFARKFNMLGNGQDMASIAAKLKAAEGTLRSKVFRMTQEAWLSALLSSVRTHTVNVVSNMFTVGFLPFERAFSAGIGQHFAKTPAEALRLKTEFSVAIGEYTSMWASLGEAFAAAKTTFKGGDNVLSPSSTLTDILGRGDRSALNSKGLNVSPKAAKAIDDFGAMVALPLRALRGSDEFFKNLAYRARARSELLQLGVSQNKSGPALAEFVETSMDRMIFKGQALSVDQIRRQAVEQAKREGYTGIHAFERTERLVGDATSSDWYKELSPLSQTALDKAEEATFTRALDPNSISGAFANMIQRHPMLKFAVPFVKTPVNLMLFGAQRADVYGVSKWLFETKLLGKPGSAFEKSRNRFLRDMASGDPIRAAQAKGRLMTGSAVASGIAAMYGAGIITGRGPSDPAERRALMESGWLPYSIKLGDTYVSYARLDPLATMIGTVADVAEASAMAGDDKQRDLSEVGMGVITALANNLTNKTYLQGVSNLVELLNNPDQRAGKYTRNFIASFIPNAARDVANLATDFSDGDDTQKEIRSTLDAIMSKIPGLADNLEPRRNALGEKIRRVTSLGSETVGPLANAVVPVQSRRGGDALMQEMAGLEYGFANPNSSRGGYDMLDIRHGSGQTAYDRWMENSASVKIGGRTLRKALEQMIATREYQSLSKLSANSEPSPRTSKVKTLIDQYRRMALEKTQREIPELNQAEMNSRLTRAASRAGVTIGAR